MATEMATPPSAASSPWTLERKQLLVGTSVHSKTREELEMMHNAAVAVDGRGTIVGMQRGCGSVAEAREALLGELDWRAEYVDECATGPGQFFFPGFIDTHVHAPQYPNVGIFSRSTLLDWLQRYTLPLEASLADLAKARRVYTACVRRQLAHGTTTAALFAIIDVPATNLLADLCLELGLRALVGRVCMDRPGTCPDYYRDASADAAVRATTATVRHIRRVDAGRGLVTPIVTPRFAPACSSELMHGLAALRREHDLAVQTHVSEQVDKVALVAELFPEAGSYAAVYDRHGLLTHRTVLAHAVHLTEAEAALTVDEVLYLATRGGVEVLGLADAVGAFAVSMQWDAQLVGLGFVDAYGGPAAPDAGNVDLFGWETWDDRVAKWLYGGDDRNTIKVWVQGRLVHERAESPSTPS